MKLAAIDVGSNSIHMIVAEAHGDSFEVIDREKEMVLLGQSVFEHGALSTSALAAGIGALERMSKLAERHGVVETVAVATAATREAQNGGEFLDAIQERLGFRVRVISGAEEAGYIYLAVRHALDLSSRRVVALDVGGGSVELLVGDSRELQLARSLKLGVQRLRAAHGGGAPLGKRELKALEQQIEAVAEPIVREAKAAGYDFACGTSGTMLALGQAVGLPAMASPTGQTLSLGALRELAERLVAVGPAERRALHGVDPRRADTLHLGAVLAVKLLEMLGLDSLTLCDAALREGLVIDYIERQRETVVGYDVVRDIRRHSVLGLARRCGQAGPHAERVAELSLSLFDQLSELHGLGDTERRLLEYSAWLHDVGQHIAFERHEHHAAYIIRNAELRGFTDEERALLALVARYHRKQRPKQKDPDFAALSTRARRTVSVLAGIVRVADGLDRSHHQVVDRVQVLIGERSITLRAITRDDAELELWGAARKVGLLERVLGRDVRLLFEASPRARLSVVRAAH